MSPINVLDKYYLGITVLVTVAYQLTGFFIAWTFQFDKITDFTGGSNFFLLAILTLCLGNVYSARNVVASVLVMIWAVRISGFLLFRVLKRGSDNRFDDIRKHFFKFLGFWIGQILWIWTVSLPLTVLNSPAVSNLPQPSFGTGSDIIGIVIWGIGWFFESWGDIEKYRFKANGSSPKDQPMMKGLWAWSRHPPYFGEILCWWGIWTLCVAPSVRHTVDSSTRSAQYGALASPLFTMVLLLFGSGIPTAEKPQARRFFLLSHTPVDRKPEYANAWDNYKIYLKRTSPLFPIPPLLYVRLPQIVKTLFLLDLPMYKFDEERDGKQAIEEEQRKHGQA
ncbi:DUF1295-domain-containing protein [Flagelloscypha sp. PMI_526]|nr:DUF1295-domain-containing protein [Flagelloscypha sp. PMI_526]